MHTKLTASRKGSLMIVFKVVFSFTQFYKEFQQLELYTRILPSEHLINHNFKWKTQDFIHTSIIPIKMNQAMYRSAVLPRISVISISVKIFMYSQFIYI